MHTYVGIGQGRYGSAGKLFFGEYSQSTMLRR